MAGEKVTSRQFWLIAAAALSLGGAAVAGYFYWDVVVLGALAALMWAKKLATLKGLLLVLKKLPLLLLLGLKRLIIRITSRFLLFSANLRFRLLRRWLRYFRMRAWRVKNQLKNHWDDLAVHEQVLATLAALPLALVLLGMLLFLFLPKALVSFVVVRLKEHSSAAVLSQAARLGARGRLHDAERMMKTRIRQVLASGNRGAPMVRGSGKRRDVMPQNYHIIGDIHGQADKLELLLHRLGYRKVEGVYCREDAKVVFLGDFIDRGPHQRRVIDIVRPMVAGGHALAVMGNHEFNALCYHSLHPETAEPLRLRSEKNRAQHQAFLREYDLYGEETREIIRWFRSLPLHLEVKDGRGQPLFRAVHACWNGPVVGRVPFRLSEECLLDACREDMQVSRDLELLLKGPEIPLPEGVSFLDKDGVERSRIRVKWWNTSRRVTYRDIAMVPDEAVDGIPRIPVPAELVGRYRYGPEEPPVFFGHYWLTGAPVPLRHNLACLDYSAGRDGELVAYCWNEEERGRPLAQDRFVRA